MIANQTPPEELGGRIDQSARFIDLSPDLMCVVGFDGYLKQINRKWTQLLGWSEAELLSQPVMNIVHPDDQASLKAARSEVREGRDIGYVEVRYQDKTGGYHWIWWRIYPHPEEQIIYAIGRDVTDRKRAEQALTQIETAVRHAPNTERDRALQIKGLTPAEMRVALLLESGLTIREAASKLCVSVHTTRTQLKQIYSKTSTHHLGEFLALLWRTRQLDKI